MPCSREFELRPFQDRVHALVTLFHEAPAIRLNVIGTIAAGRPIEALPDQGETIEIPGPAHAVQQERILPALRRHLCPALDRVSSDAFEIARVITPLLAGLKLSGKVDLDLDPWLFAGIALVISRMGVATFCTEDESAASTAPQSPARARTARRRKRPRRHARR